MAIINNRWVGYLDRSYQQIKTKLLSRLSTNAPELTDHSEGNPLVVILDMFAGIVEGVHYYIDNLGREAFISTVRRYKNMVRLISILDYRIPASTPESTMVEFTLNLPAPAGGVYIPQGVQLSSPLISSTYQTSTVGFIPEGSTKVLVPAVQVTIETSILGNTDGTNNQVIPLPVKYANGSLELTIGGEIYYPIESFAKAGPDSLVFIVDINPDKQVIATLGDGVNGKLPTPGLSISGTYQLTDNSLGAIRSGGLTQIDTTISLPTGYNITATNTINSSGGSAIPGINYIRAKAPLSIRTLNRAVSKTDFNDIAKSYNGVFEAEHHFCCGHTVDIYIAPLAGNTGGIATPYLLAGVKSYFEDKRLVTKKVNPLAAGLSYIVIRLSLTTKFRRDPAIAKSTVETTLLTEFGYNNSHINRAIRVSDILSVVDNLDIVDFTNLGVLYLLPYPRPVKHLNELVWDIDILPGATSLSKYIITYNSLGKFIIFWDNIYMGTILPGQPWTNNQIVFTIPASPYYVAGNSWEFTVYPYNLDIEVDDYTVPLLLEANLAIQVDIPQPKESKC